MRVGFSGRRTPGGWPDYHHRHQPRPLRRQLLLFPISRRRRGSHFADKHPTSRLESASWHVAPEMLAANHNWSYPVKRRPEAHYRCSKICLIRQLHLRDHLPMSLLGKYARQRLAQPARGPLLPCIRAAKSGKAGDFVFHTLHKSKPGWKQISYRGKKNIDCHLMDVLCALWQPCVWSRPWLSTSVLAKWKRHTPMLVGIRNQ